ncbi:ABC transporter permease subunit [Trinickia caryophylli]|nr:ABC transporter permease subunit [Trinickia caryophylli]WQE10365.1 ABC transporter permease subunit [Trinickia caryophylli]
MSQPINSNAEVTLDAANLPYYSSRTTMRFLLGLVCSTLFSFSLSVLAARYTPMRRIILPFIDFVQSVPLVGFMTFTTAFFLNLFPNNTMGMEAAAVFAVFTGQTWNMMLSLYQTIKVVPQDLRDVADSFNYNAWQRFWRLEWPYSAPGFLWNVINSQTAAWFALVASEAIPAAKGGTVLLPGIGSYVSVALRQGSVPGIAWAFIALALNVVLTDQLVFRPLVRYTIRFKNDNTSSRRDGLHRSWLYDCLRASSIAQGAVQPLRAVVRFWLFQLPKAWYALHLHRVTATLARLNQLWATLWYAGLATAGVYVGYKLWTIYPKDSFDVLPWWMLETVSRVLLAIVLSMLLFVPIGVWLARAPRRLAIAQPVVQILAAMPSNIYYPIIAFFVTTRHQSHGWWTIPMIMAGTQWYYLFNTIGGTLAIPNHITDVSRSFGLRGKAWWRLYMLPSIYPYLVTGTIAAVGGAWNAAIAAEVMQWGSQTVHASGLGAYISQAMDRGDEGAVALGCSAMCLMVGIVFVFVWRPLHRFAEHRYRHD